MTRIVRAVLAWTHFRHVLVASALLLSLLGCGNEENKEKRVALLPRSKAARDTVDRNPGVMDLLPITGDTLIAARSYWGSPTKHGGVAITTDAGKHWQTLHRNRTGDLSLDELTVDNHGVLWGLTSSVAFERVPNHARLYRSRDFGKTWDSHPFDTRTFHPTRVGSQPGKPLHLVTKHGKVYRLQDPAGKEWKFIQYDPELDSDSLATHFDEARLGERFNNGTYRFRDGGQLSIRTGGQWKPVATISFINTVSDVCPCDTSLYVTAKNDALNPSPNYLLRVVDGQVRHIILTPEGTNHLRCDDTGRLWVFSEDGIWEMIWGTALKKRF
jgi:hypothetical protein